VKYIIAFIAGWCLAAISVSAMPYIRILGVTPDLALIFAATWSVVRGQDEAMIVVPMVGLLRDLTTSDPLGLSILGLAPIVLLTAAVQLRRVDTEFLPTVIVVSAGSFAFGVISMLVLTATGQHVPWVDGVLRVVVPTAVVNALFTPVVYLPVRWLGSRSTVRVMGPGRISSPV
jgi:rod shape-determining protein MreD